MIFMADFEVIFCRNLPYVGYILKSFLKEEKNEGKNNTGNSSSYKSVQ
jgi:hypothetical protein